MVLAGPGPVGLGLGLGVMGGEVTDILDGGGDGGLGGGLDARVSGGDAVFPWRKKRQRWTGENGDVTKLITCGFFFNQYH